MRHVSRSLAKIARYRNLSLVGIAIFALVFASCKEEGENGNGDNNPVEVPPATARISGIVSDTNGVPLSEVSLRVVYEIAQAQAGALPMTPSIVILYSDQVLTTQCDNFTLLPDGITVKVFWDSNSNGPDESDPQPPPCPEGDCEGLGPGYVSYNEFRINGVESGFGAGTFYNFNTFGTTGDVFSPNLFYLRIYCSDGGVLWTSEVADLPAGPSEWNARFECDSCSGIPEIPQWLLQQAFPNPTTNTATIVYGLQEPAQALLTLRRAGISTLDTLLNASLPAGTRSLELNFAGRANGLYHYVYRAGSFQRDGRVLFNQSNRVVLKTQPALAVTDAGGGYNFGCAAGEGIEMRDANNAAIGTATLNRLRVIASRSGFQDADTAVTVSSEQQLELNLRLRP